MGGVSQPALTEQVGLLPGDLYNAPAGFDKACFWSMEQPPGSHPACKDVVARGCESNAAPTEMASQGKDVCGLSRGGASTPSPNIPTPAPTGHEIHSKPLALVGMKPFFCDSF